MNKLPLLDKNAYLKIFVTQAGIYSHLAYSHYDLGRSYILKDHSILPVGFDKFTDSQLSDFWSQYVGALEEKFGWKLMTTVGGVNMLTPFTDEENGVNGLVIVYDDVLGNLQNQLAGVRNFCSDVKFEKFGDAEFMKLFRGFLTKFDYKDVIHIDLNTTGSQVIRYEREHNLGKLDLAYSDYRFHKMHAKKLTTTELIDGVRDIKFKAFLREDSANNQLSNYLANYLVAGVVDTDVALLKDILRSYGMIQLLSIFNANKAHFTGFGVQPFGDEHAELKDYAVIVTGELGRIVDSQDLIISILDGLQIRGHFDLFYDFDRLLCTYGNSYFFGINSQDIILSRHEILSSVDRVVIPEISREKKERKVVMSGVMSSADSGNVPIYALAPQIVTVDIPKQKMFFDFEFIGDNFVKDIGQKIRFDYDPEKHQFSRFIFDCRFKPVVYGPDAKTNKLRLEEWFHE